MKNREIKPAQTSTGDGGAPLSAGRFTVNRERWQTIVAGLDKPTIYRISNSSAQSSTDPGNALLVQWGEPPRVTPVQTKNTVDVQSKSIAVRAGDGGKLETATGWYEIVSD